jgi:uncharacterized protein YjiS (DUF1127 family)
MSSQLAKASGNTHYGVRPDTCLTFSKLPSRLGTWFVRSVQRRALRELAHDVKLLADMGIDRQQALREAAKPFWRQ